MRKFNVWGLDVWGHGHDECSSCKCPGGDLCEGYSVNDRFKIGTIEIDGKTSVVKILVDAGFLTPDCTDDTIEVDGDPDFMLEVNRKSDGKYLLQLEHDK